MFSIGRIVSGLGWQKGDENSKVVPGGRLWSIVEWGRKREDDKGVVERTVVENALQYPCPELPEELWNIIIGFGNCSSLLAISGVSKVLNGIVSRMQLGSVRNHWYGSYIFMNDLKEMHKNYALTRVNKMSLWMMGGASDLMDSKGLGVNIDGELDLTDGLDERLEVIEANHKALHLRLEEDKTMIVGILFIIIVSCIYLMMNNYSTSMTGEGFGQYANNVYWG